MTLLRMLSFGPSGARQQRAHASAKTNPSVAAVSVQAPPAAPYVAPTAAAPGAFNGDWISLVGKLKLGGMAMMLAQHCELNSMENDHFKLTLPPAHKHLAEKPYQEKLKNALAEHFGRPFKLNIELGVTTGPTPVQVQQNQKAEREQRAIESIEQDPFVRDLVEQFDAKVIESTIKPLQQ